MERGLYIAASGMLAEQVRQDQIANDLANASTTGYKADRSAQHSFGEMLLQNSATGNVIGPLSLGSHIAVTRTDLSQGPLRQTGEPLDVALSGPGFLAVQTPNGVRYSRDGELAINAGGQLVNSAGLPVLGTDGRPITVSGPDKLQIASDGTVSDNGRTAGTLAVVSLTNPQKQGDTLFTGTPGAKPAGTEVLQGSLEGSGVDPVRTMVDMISSLRAFESSQRVIHAIDDTLSKAVTSVGSASGN
jgi:flagellar basal-body rod protein FlgF